MVLKEENSMSMYKFAVNPLKLQRAIAAAGPDATMEEIKAKYVAFGGLIDETVAVVEEEVVEEAPKKRSKKDAD